MMKKFYMLLWLLASETNTFEDFLYTTLIYTDIYIYTYLVGRPTFQYGTNHPTWTIRSLFLLGSPNVGWIWWNKCRCNNRLDLHNCHNVPHICCILFCSSISFISFSFVGWILCEPQQSLCSRTRTFLLRYLEYEYTRCSPLQHLILHLKKDKRMNATSLVVRCLSAKKQKSTFPMLINISNVVKWNGLAPSLQAMFRSYVGGINK